MHRILKFAAILFAFFVAFVGQSHAANIVLCNTCVTQTDYERFAEGTVSGQSIGQFEIEVVNVLRFDSYFVTIEKEREYNLYFTITTSERATEAQRADIAAVWPAFEKAEHAVVITGDTPGTQSWGQHTREGVGSVIIVQPWMLTALGGGRRIDLWGALKAWFGYSPVAVVVFANGDVAKFRVNNPMGTAAGCCEYIPGTARNALGEYISDSGLGGSGSSNGDGYVQVGYGQNGDNEIRIRVNTVLYICSFVSTAHGRELIGCYVQDP